MAAATYTLMDLANHLRALSRAAVFFHHAGTESAGDDLPALWDTATDLNLYHAGDTEGPFQTTFAMGRSELMIPEMTGDLVHKSYISGQVPSITGNVWMADPNVREKWSPLGLNHGGHELRLEDAGVTMAVIPFELLVASDGQTLCGIQYDPATLTWKQQPLDADGNPSGAATAVPASKTHLLDAMVWLWKVKRERPPVTLQHDDGSRSLEEVNVTGMWHPSLPNGHHAFTIGRPEHYGIDILPLQ